MFSITILMKAVGKGRPRMTRAGHMYTPKETRDAEAKIRYLVAKEKPEMLLGPVFVDLRIEIKRGKKTGDYPDSKPHYDADNVLKLVTDSLNGVAYKDDVQICSIKCEKYYGPEDLISITIGDLDKVS